IKGQTGEQEVLKGQQQIKEAGQETQEQLQTTVENWREVYTYTQGLSGTITLLQDSIPALHAHEQDLTKSADQMQSDLKAQLENMGNMGTQITKEVFR